MPPPPQTPGLQPRANARLQQAQGALAAPDTAPFSGPPGLRTVQRRVPFGRQSSAQRDALHQPMAADLESPPTPASPCPAPAASPATERVLAALRQVIDPELGINIVDLGLIYDIDAGDRHVRVDMTLTTPGCPLHESITSAAEMAVRVLVPGAESVAINLVWSPPWCADRISAAGRAELGWR